jgi:arabinogalactan endo-1,4-beta-galactosidase
MQSTGKKVIIVHAAVTKKQFHLLLDLHYSDSWADPGK